MRTVHPDRTRLARATGLGALLAAGSLTAAGATGRAAVLSWPGAVSYTHLTLQTICSV